MNFQKTTVSIAIVIFIITITLIGILLNNTKNNSVYPPEIGSCPDYWKKMSDGKCFNPISGLGKQGCKGPIDFEVDPYIGKNGKKAKCNYAKGCDLAWDGITNIGLC